MWELKGAFLKAVGGSQNWGHHTRDPHNKDYLGVALFRQITTTGGFRNLPVLTFSAASRGYVGIACRSEDLEFRGIRGHVVWVPILRVIICMCIYIYIEGKLTAPYLRNPRIWEYIQLLLD